jgi:hypothetical protein
LYTNLYKGRNSTDGKSGKFSELKLVASASP